MLNWLFNDAYDWLAYNPDDEASGSPLRILVRITLLMAGMVLSLLGMGLFFKLIGL